jgi:tripeptide aminopeptidase
MMRKKLGLACAALLLSIGAANAQSDVDDVVTSASFQRAADYLAGDHARFVDELVRITEVPAPPFNEQARAIFFAELLRESGLTNVEIDAEGNVIGVREGSGGGGLLAVLAHLDTVFPPDTDVGVRRDGATLYAPGVGDDSRGLAAMLALVRALDAAGIETQSDVLFVGNVGEEGLGDLRGTKYLLLEGPFKDRITHFISLDGRHQANGEWPITNGGVGSKRYRAIFSGPGGHSFSAFGMVNPANALANAITRLSHAEVPESPKTTFNVGVVNGGTSVNSIPTEVWMQVDLRSEASDALARLDAYFQSAAQRAVDDENNRALTHNGRIIVELEVVGDRPAGQTPQDAQIVQLAADAATHFGLEPTYRSLSTDSNIPMSIGIPAVTLSTGHSDRAHSLEEWTNVDPENTALTNRVLLATILAIAGFVE